MKDRVFGVLQRVGRSFMLPIAILPVAGLLLGIGGSRLDMMQRVFRGRMLPLLALFCGCLIPQFLVQINCDTAFNGGIAFLLGAVILLYVAIFVHYGLDYMKYKKKLGR